MSDGNKSAELAGIAPHANWHCAVGAILAELRGIYAELPDNADVSGRALWELIKRLEGRE